jgi:hypothetical protein
MQLALYPDPLSRDDFKDLSSQLVKLEKTVRDLQRTILGKNAAPPAQPSANGGAISLISAAYAASDTDSAPDWAKRLPNDPDSIYFVAVANDATAAAAREAAQQQAKAAVETSLATALNSYSQIPADDVGHLAQQIAKSAEIVSTFVVPTGGTYRGYALARVSKPVAMLSAKSFFLAHNVPFDPKLLGLIAAGRETEAAATAAANQQKTAAQNGVAYIHVASPTDRSIGEALRQSLSEVISAPPIEVQVSEPTNTLRYFGTDDLILAKRVRDAAEKAMTAEGYTVQLELKDEQAEGFRARKSHFELWLGPLPHIPPRIHFEVEAGTPPDRVAKLKQELTGAGYQVPKIESVSGIPSQEARLFYYRKSDVDEANSLAKTLSSYGLSSAGEAATLAKAPSDFRPRHYDLRIGKSSFSAEPGP